MADGTPISFLALSRGTPVVSREGAAIGRVEHVMHDEGTDVFDGLVIDTDGGKRFVDAPDIVEIYEERVELALTAEQAAGLHEPSANPAVLAIDEDDLEHDTAGERLQGLLRKAWRYVSGDS
jgi:uncharacterized protein YrrD